MKRQKTRFTGVYYRQSSSRRHNGKPDRCFDISYKRFDGRKMWEKIGWASEGYTPAMAVQIRGDRLKAIRHGDELPQKKKKITFATLADKYIDWAKQNKKSYQNDITRYNLHLKPALKDKTLDEVTPFLLEKIKIKLMKDHSPATTKHVLVLCRQMINKAIAWGMWTGENPIKRVKLPSQDNQRTRFLSPDEANKLLQECKRRSEQLYEIVLMSLQTGMRAGEIFNLRWADIDLINDLIIIKDAKSGKSRHAYITSDLKTLLKSKEPGTPDEFVFQSRNGGKIDRVSHSFDRTVNALGFNEGVKDARDKIVFHSLRHTFASWLVQNGESLVTVARLLGHSDLSMVNRYAHLSPQQGREAALGVAELIKEKVMK